MQQRQLPPPRRRALSGLLAMLLVLVLVGLAAAVVAAAGSDPSPTATPGLLAGGTALPAPTPVSSSRAPTTTPSPSPSARPAPSAAPKALPPSAWLPKGPFSMDIYRPGIFVSQIDKDHCMSAAMQNMLNLIGPTVDTSAAYQKRIAAVALRLSNDSLDHGYGPNGWAAGLTQMGAGQYRVVIYDTRAAALKAAVIALRTTGRPVGILAWWGAHSWVLTGFKASADPATTTNFTVSGYDIVDPWYPRISSIWGAAKPPDTLRTPAEMIHNLPAWTRPEGHYPTRDGKWLLVLPIGTNVPRTAMPAPAHLLAAAAR